MNKYSLACSCGHVMKVEAANKNEAIKKLKETMNEETVVKHWEEKHPGETPPAIAAVQSMIEQNTR